MSRSITQSRSQQRFRATPDNQRGNQVNPPAPHHDLSRAKNNPDKADRRKHQQKVEQKEAARRAAMAAQQKRKADFAKRCSGKTGLSEPELEACRAAYRKL